MKKIDIDDFYKEIGYNYKKDLEYFKTIFYYTKTGVNPSLDEHYIPDDYKKHLLIKAIAEKNKFKSYLEIGTGRGTSCYLVSLLSSIKDIYTFDIIKFDELMDTAIGYRKANVSNKDIYNMIPYDTKKKINFYHIRDLNRISKNMESVDMCNIDGEHNIYRIIMRDFKYCNSKLRDGGIMIFDDYTNDNYKVKDVVDDILKKNKFKKVYNIDNKVIIEK